MDFLGIAIALLFAGILIQAILTLKRGKPKNLPPGPVPLPVIGSLHKLGEQPHMSLAQLAKTYGPIMSLKLGRITTVVISSSATAQEVLQQQDLAFSGRFIPDALHAHDHYKFSVGWLPVASRWRSLRKILNSHIFSGNRLEANADLRRRKVEELVTYCRESSRSREPVNIGRAAFRTTLNLLSNTIFSVDLADPNHDTGKEFKDLVSNIMAEVGKPNLVDFFPIFKWVDPQGILRRTTIHYGKILSLFNGMISERSDKHKSNKSETKDVLDVLLNISKDNPEEIDRTHMKHLCSDLFVAGTDTTSSTVEWAMAELLKSPDSMEKAKAELQEVVGRGKAIEEAQIPHLLYLRSIVKETLRLHSPVPFLIPRQVETDVHLCGYTIPAGSQVLVNAWAIGRDPITWESPLEFRPERFLGSEIDVKGRDFGLIPFGAGRRICPGVPLAMRMIPVMVGSLINSFDWRVEGKELDMEDKFGITLQKARPLRAIPIPLGS